MWIKILLLFFTFSFLFRTDLSFNQDLGRHLKLGEIILKTGQIPKTNLFSYTNPDFPFINTHWLFEILTYIFSQYLGLHTLLIFKIAIILFAVWLTLKVIPKGSAALLLPIAFIFLHVLRERLELRPEIFSFLFTASTLFILERFLKKGTRWIFLLPIIQLFWINTHIYFFVGLIIQAVFLIHLTYQNLRSHIVSGNVKLLGGIFILSVLASLINPNGLAGLLYPLTVTKNYGYTIVENQNMFLLESINFRDPNFLFVKLSIGIVLISIMIVILNTFASFSVNSVKNLKIKSRDPSRPKPSASDDQDDRLKNILLSLSGMVLALSHVRSFPYLVFLSLPGVLGNIGVVRPNNLTKIFAIGTGFLLLLESFFYLNGDYYRFNDNQHTIGLGFEENVKAAMNFVIQNDLPGPIYNNFDIGSYLIYRGYPKYKVFIDGRPEAYPVSFFQQIYIPSQSDYPKFKELESQYGFKTIIFSHTDQTPWGRNFLQSVIKDEAWELVYIDDFTVVITTPEVVNQKQLPVIDLAKLIPASYRFGSHISYLRLGIFLLNNQYTDSGRQFIMKTLQLFPNDPFANSLIGQTSKNIYLW